MEIVPLHSWEVDFDRAREIQANLRRKLVFEDVVPFQNIRLIAAADVSFNRFGKVLYGAVVLIRFPELEVVEMYTEAAQVTFPYVPGYLSFREAPVILNIFRKINTIPQVLLCDGQGVAHPRGFGLASHLGMFLDIPTIGCAKSLLVGEYDRLGEERGAVAPLVYRGNVVGRAVRTRRGVKPVFVSVGHKISLETATRVVLAASPRYRIPEPLRQAHQLVNEFRKENEKKKRTDR